MRLGAVELEVAAALADGGAKLNAVLEDDEAVAVLTAAEVPVSVAGAVPLDVSAAVAVAPLVSELLAGVVPLGTATTMAAGVP